MHTVCDWNAYAGGFMSYACYNAIIVLEFLYGSHPWWVYPTAKSYNHRNEKRKQVV